MASQSHSRWFVDRFLQRINRRVPCWRRLSDTITSSQRRARIAGALYTSVRFGEDWLWAALYLIVFTVLVLTGPRQFFCGSPSKAQEISRRILATIGPRALRSRNRRGLRGGGNALMLLRSKRGACFIINKTSDANDAPHRSYLVALWFAHIGPGQVTSLRRMSVVLCN